MGGGEIRIWVVCDESKCYIPTRVDLDDVTAYGSYWRIDRCTAVNASVGCGALYDLEVVAV